MKNIVSRIIVVVIIAIVTMFACKNDTPVGNEFNISTDHLYPIEIYATVIPEHLSLGLLISFSLKIVNREEEIIEECCIIFDSEYRANLNQLARQNPATGWDYPKISDIPPKSELVFEFSSDVENDWEFRNDKGEIYKSIWGPPKTISIESSNYPDMKWVIQGEFNQPLIYWSRKTIPYIPVKVSYKD